MDIKEFVEQSGSVKKAADRIGTTPRTLYRWAHGISDPRGLNMKRKLRRLGVEI